MVDDITHQAALGSSDHDGLLWNYTTKSGLWASYTGGKTKNYAKGDYEKIRSQFRETDWNSKLDGLSCEDAWDKFKVAYNDAVDKNVPLRTKKKNKPPWLKSSVKKSITSCSRDIEKRTSTMTTSATKNRATKPRSW